MSSSSVSTVQKDSSLDSQESNNQDKTQLSLTRCNSVDSKAHLVLNACKTDQVKYNTIPALKVHAASANSNINCSSVSKTTTNNSSTNTSSASSPPPAPTPTPPTPPPQSTARSNSTSSANCYDSAARYSKNHHANLRIHMDSEGGILNTAFIDNTTTIVCPIHRTSSPSVYTSHCNDIQLRRHSAYAKVYGDTVNDNKCNLNQHHTHRPISFVQTIVTNNGHVTSVQQQQQQQHQQHHHQLQQHQEPQHQHKDKQQNIQPHIKETDNGKIPHKRCWLKTKK